MDKKTAIEIIDKLNVYHKGAGCELNFTTPFELLVAVILSAQCTDKRVNEVTKELFKKYNKPIDYCNAKIENIEKAIFSCGFYRNKAKNIVGAAREILERYNGVVPSTQKELESLPGVGRKTANVVYSVAFGGDAIAVDTHVFRVSNRIGLVNAKSPEETEKQLNKILPREMWSHAHHLLIFQGRYVCSSQSPKCEICPVMGECNYYKRGVGNE